MSQWVEVGSRTLWHATISPVVCLKQHLWEELQPSTNTVGEFFDNLTKVMDRFKFPPNIPSPGYVSH
ncbi:hypothetical protein PFLUV_G00123430 [Perca fluviatilis]|uniref:Uncharacterized protein n=1 Tax=Perca fluviatilis TaxID=8168 RepID=A0A6A5F6L0_PERFL|nr:hypothetical protein PFLUV_G00123430 [Perca fluviatilis]